MAEKKVKTAQIGGELLEWLEKGENSPTESIRTGLRILKKADEEINEDLSIKELENKLIDYIPVYNNLYKEYNGNINFHLPRMINIYNKYLAQIENIKVNLEPDNTNISFGKEETSKTKDKKEEKNVDELENNLDKL